MSGGSFNYLCYTDDIYELVAKQGELEAMRDALSALDYAGEEACETQELLDLIEQLNTKAEASIKDLKSVWKAVEWWRSCDYSEDQVREAIVERRLRKEPDMSIPPFAGTPFVTTTQPKQSGWKRGLAKIEAMWAENPMGVAIVAAGVMTAGAKLIDSIGSYKSKKAYAKDAERRSRMR